MTTKTIQHEGCATVTVTEELPLFELTDAEGYDTKHPDIWTAFEKIALNLIDRNIKHYGSKAIFEIIRYERTLKIIEGELFKVNNNYTPYYAQKFLDKYPEHTGFFEIRTGGMER